MIENQIQNLLCLKIILEHGTPEYMKLDFVRHTDEYKKELCMRYLGFIPSKENGQGYIQLSILCFLLEEGLRKISYP